MIGASSLVNISQGVGFNICLTQGMCIAFIHNSIQRWGMISLCISIKYMAVTVQIGNLLHVDQFAKAVKDSKCCNRILYVGGPLFSESALTPIPG